MALSALAIPFVFLTSCATPAPQPVQKAAEPKPSYHIDGPAANDISRFLAGMSGRADGPFKKLEQEAAWKAYAAEFDDKWKKLNESQVAAVRSFQAKELAPVLAKSKSDFVFYPFSGPDVLYLTTFFPDGKINVMVGLEPVGNLPEGERFTAETLPNDLQGWRVGIASLYSRTFFVTSEMDRQFRGRVADGLLPMIALLLVRTGNTLEGIRFIRPGANGDPEPVDISKTVDENGKKIRHPGVEISYRPGNETQVRKIFYFSTDMAKFGANTAFQQFLKKLGRSDTLVKSASFLLHWKMCEDIRNFILDQSNMILEDDTGIQYKILTKAKWNIALYGQYSRPDKPFRNEHQPDLEAAFEDREHVKDLGFSLGYGSGRRPSHLLLAVRTPETLPAPPPGPAVETTKVKKVDTKTQAKEEAQAGPLP